jgi:hypothetical protein
MVISDVHVTGVMIWAVAANVIASTVANNAKKRLNMMIG